MRSIQVGVIALCGNLIASTSVSAQDPSENQIDRLFSSYDHPSVPGASVVVIRDGQIVFEKGYGLADIQSRAPVTPRTNFRLASVSKAFTAMAIMILKDRGQLSYEQPLSDFFANFPSVGRKITVRHLLNHLGGLVDYEDLIPPEQIKQLSDIDVLRLIEKSGDTYFTPGSRYRYSNGGYVLLGLIVSHVSGKSFAEFLRDEIFLPLSMTDTVAYEPGISNVSNRAYGYSQNGNGFVKTDQSVTSATLGDGGIYTSPHEMFLWDQTFYQNSLVSDATLAEALKPGRLSSGSLTSYGFGWDLGSYRGLKKISHTGSTIGFRTAYARFPDKRFSIAVLINRANTTPMEICHQLADLYLFKK